MRFLWARPLPCGPRMPHETLRALSLTLILVGCRQGELGEVSCDAVDEHLRALALPAAPGGLVENERVGYAAALSEAGGLRCAELTPEQRACALHADTFSAAYSCLPTAAAATSVVHDGERLVGPTSAPPLPVPVLSPTQ